MGPRPKIAAVERREGSRSQRDAVVAPRTRDRKKECACRRSARPSFGVGIAADDLPLSPRSWREWPPKRRQRQRRCGGDKARKARNNPDAQTRRGNEEAYTV